ncbi:MAG: YbgA family protein [Caryophanon sp.]|nr:YbgA family protein [Caryophanon sp.]
MKRQAEIRWREEKYRVMFHSQKHYNAIRVAMREQQPYETIAAMIDDAIAQTPTSGSMRNAIQHMWGYFKKHVIPEQKAHYDELMTSEQYDDVCRYLYELAKQYDVTYLTDSTVLKGNE